METKYTMYSYTGDEEPDTSAEFEAIYGVAVYSNGNVYIRDNNVHVIRVLYSS